MKALIISLLSLFVINVYGQTPSSQQVEEMTLSNGMRVWINEDHSQPKVFGAVVVNCGAIDCPNTGIAHYLEHILFKGTDRMGTTNYKAEKQWLDSISARYDQLAETTDRSRRMKIQKDINRLSEAAVKYAIPNEFNTLTSRYGGSGLNAATSYETTCYYNIFLPQYIRQWAELNSERFITPVFRMFQSELETVYEEKNMYSDNVIMSAFQKAIEAVYRGTPYQYPIIGSTENLKNPRLAEMHKFYDKYYVASNMTLILSGDVYADSIKELLEKTFGRIKRGERAQRTPITWKSTASEQTVKIKIPMPLLKASAHIYRVPGGRYADNQALDIAMSLLTNSNKTGLLDSLETSHKVMAVIGQSMIMRNVGAVIIGVIPKLPFGSKKKAEKMVMEQVERLRAGLFSEEALTEAKRTALQTFERNMENADNRSMLMLNAITSTDMTWNEYVKLKRGVVNITKADIVAVMNKYIGGNSLRLVKKFGSYPKDRVYQPGYSPVKATNINAESEFVRQLASIPINKVEPRFVDFDKDAETVSIGSKATLYTVKNPANKYFSLRMTYLKGTVSDRCLEMVGEYLPEIGTDSLSSRKFGEAMRRLNTTVEFSANKENFNISLYGPDSNLESAVKLLGHFLDRMKSDPKAFKDLKTGYAIERSAFSKSYMDIAMAAVSRVMYGDKSPYLRYLSGGQLNKLTGDSIINTFNTLRKTECYVTYSGNIKNEDVARYVKRYLRTDLSVDKSPDTFVERNDVEKSVVYIYPAAARQNIIAVYMPLPKADTYHKRALQKAWGRYFGGGMSSIMFRELRELRSFAYYASGINYFPKMSEHADKPTAFIAIVGTQADKTLSATHVLDSLFNDMPVREKDMTLARQEILNNISNNYPSFRGIAEYVASGKADGYAVDPNKYIYKEIRNITGSDIESFYKSNRPTKRAIIIVGSVDKKMRKELSAYGEVKILKRKDIISF